MTDQAIEHDNQPLHDDHEALVTTRFCYVPRQHSALWDVFSVDGDAMGEIRLLTHMGTHRPARDHRNVFGYERDLVRRQAAAAVAVALNLSDPSFEVTLPIAERRWKREAGKVVQRDGGGPIHLRRRQYGGWTTCENYVVTEPIDDVVDVYERDTWRLLGSYELPPALRLRTGMHAHTSGGDHSSEATYDRWGAAVVGLGLYCEAQAGWVRSELRRDPPEPPPPVDPAQLEFDFGDFEPRPWACAATAAVQERAS